MTKLNAILIIALLCFTACLKSNDGIPSKPSQRAYVFDYADLIDQETERKLQDLGQELQQKTTAELVVITLEKNELPSIKDLAYKTFNAWKLGDAKKHNGCLLLLIKDNLMADRKGRCRIEVGKGLEGRLNDAKCGRVLDELLLPGFTPEAQQKATAKQQQEKQPAPGTPAPQDGAQDTAAPPTPNQAIFNAYAFLAQEIATEYGQELDLDRKIELKKVKQKPFSWIGVVKVLGFILAMLIILRLLEGKNFWRSFIPFGGRSGYGRSHGGFGGGGYFGGGSDFGGGSSGGGGADR